MGLNYESLRRHTLEVSSELKEMGYSIHTAILFGSFAKGTATEHSDIDLAFISKDFGNDSLKENSLLNRLLSRRLGIYDVIAIPLKDYLDTFPISPIAWEIKQHGIPLF
jgi:predicted nucleotidyltransferase